MKKLVNSLADDTRTQEVIINTFDH